MSAHQLAIRAMIHDATSHELAKLNYGVTYCGEMTTTSVQNVLTFDMRAEDNTDSQAIEFIPDFTLSKYAPAEWTPVVGESIDALLAEARAGKSLPHAAMIGKDEDRKLAKIFTENDFDILADMILISNTPFP